MRPARLAAIAAVCTAAALTLTPRPAAAFCGFYVSGADASLYNDATVVVLMRDGTRTVLAMQNNYQGPPQDFAMVVPVPVILKESDVKTLPEAVFARVDRLAAPRLVEYWEQDPCTPEYDGPYDFAEDDVDGELLRPEGAALSARRHGVTIEAKFAVGEYQILILGARDAAGLDRWLRRGGYKIPAGADAVLRPYVAAGMKFFVARVDSSKIKRGPNGQVTLSPLRFHYDSESFHLPVRLGLLNANGKQDLIVHILADQTRYEVANYRNVAIPTNLDVTAATRDNFAAFYTALFDHTLAANPGAIVTEYAWSAGTCDPCPDDPLALAELATLGVDVLPGFAPLLAGDEAQYSIPGRFVLTRLHARYGRESLGDDLVFHAAPAIEGGREVRSQPGTIEAGARPSGSANNFQARYTIRHPWTGPVACEHPRRGAWGGPPANLAHHDTLQVARDLAFAPRDVALATFLPGAAPTTTTLPPGQPIQPGVRPPETRACGHCGLSEGTAPLALLALGMSFRRRRRG